MAMNVQCMLEEDDYKLLTDRADRNDRTARREAINILKVVLRNDLRLDALVAGASVEGSEA
jgi:hypothetical protein